MLRVVFLKRWWKDHYFVFYNRKQNIILFSLRQLSFTTSFILDVFFQSINTGWSKTKIPTDTLRLLIIISLWRSMCRRLPHPPRLQPMMCLINIPRRKGHERIVFNQSGRCTCIQLAPKWEHFVACYVCLRHHIATSDAVLFSAAVSEHAVIPASSIMDHSLYHYWASVQMAAPQRNPPFFDSERVTPGHGVSELWDNFLLSNPHWCCAGNILTLCHIVHI